MIARILLKISEKQTTQQAQLTIFLTIRDFGKKSSIVHKVQRRRSSLLERIIWTLFGFPEVSEFRENYMDSPELSPTLLGSRDSTLFCGTFYFSNL